MTDVSTIRRQLADRLAELTRRSAEVERELAEPMSPDSEEQAVEAEDDEVLRGQDAALNRERDAIVATIRRIDTGRFGVCTSCGARISPIRLKVMPTAPLCIDCARAAMP